MQVLPKGTFEYNIVRANTHLQAQLSRGHNEAIYTSIDLENITSHLCDIISSNPNLSEEEINTILFNEIDDYAKTVFENAYIFGQYIEYLCAQYLSKHPEKYPEISEKLIKSNIDFEKKDFNNCRNFEEYLLVYMYSRKKDLFDQIFTGFEATIPPTQENFKKFDELLQENLRLVSKNYFESYFGLPEMSDTLASNETYAKKKSKIREYMTWYKNPKDKKDLELYSNIFLNGSYQYIVSDPPYISQELRKDLAHSTARIVEQLDSLGHLEDYMTQFVFDMSCMEYPELANVICNNNFPSSEFVSSVSSMSKELATLERSFDSASEFDKKQMLKKMSSLRRSLINKKSEIAANLNKDKLKTALGENYLYSSKNLSLEGLFALNSFWANRYVKELNLYSQSMYAVHKFDLVNKIKNNESVFVSKDELNNMLIQMYTLYYPANEFLEESQRTHSKRSEDSEEEYEDGDVEEKIIRFSYDPFIQSVSTNFGQKAYSNYFSQILPNVEHNIKDDANWYIRLHNPIYSSYLMKDEMLNALILSIAQDSDVFPNAGIILENANGQTLESRDKTKANLPDSAVLGIDAGLSFPVRVHFKKSVAVDFLRSFNGDSMLPIYEGASDFHHPCRKNNTPLSAHLILPCTDKIKNIFKTGINKTEFEGENSQFYHPNARFVSHLAFNNSKKIPKHLQTLSTSGKTKPKPTFVRRYIDLETGEIYNRVNGEYVRVEPQTFSKNQSGQGDDEHGYK